jgi:predicted phosphodiesterase
MKIALLSDIHGILPALEVVVAHIAQWQPDQVIVNGDVVNRGPSSAACLALIRQRVQEQGWRLTLGNHEEYTAAWLDQNRRLPPAESELYAVSRWTFEQTGAAAARDFSAWPAEQALALPDGGTLLATHASRLSNTDGIGPWSSDEEIREKMAPAPSIFVTAHTHRFLVRMVEQTLVINAGSVGFPFDGDSRTGYVQLAWQGGAWQAEIVRLAYDREQARRDFSESGYLAGGGPSAELMFFEWMHARSHIPHWSAAWRARVSAGEVGVRESVRAYLASL